MRATAIPHPRGEPREIQWTPTPVSSDSLRDVLVRVVERQSENSCSELIEQLVNEGFEAELPPWRLYLLQSSNHEGPFELVLRVNHLFLDGVSGAVLCRE